MHPAFIDEFQVRNQSWRDGEHLVDKLSAQAFYPWGFTLTVMQRFFLRGRFNRSNSRHIMLGLADMP
jgi:hypothetical protein